MTIQDKTDTTAEAEEPKDPWWAERWYLPGSVLIAIGIILGGLAPWTGESPGRTFGTALAFFIAGSGLLILYAYKEERYKTIDRRVGEAEQRIHDSWRSEAEYNHCHEHCSCSYCHTLRFQKVQAQGAGSTTALSWGRALKA